MKKLLIVLLSVVALAATAHAFKAKVVGDRLHENTIPGDVTFSGAVTVAGALTASGGVTGNAATATALAANPADCSANQFANAIAASGALSCSAVGNAATTAASANTASAIVARDTNGDFAAGIGTFSAVAVTGNARLAAGGVKASTFTASTGNLDLAGALTAAGAGGIAASAGPVQSYSRTLAQILAITPSAVGQQYYCNDCSSKKIVVSTGTAAGEFAAADGGLLQ